VSALARPNLFFDSVKKSLFGGKFEQAQVDGLNALLVAAGEANWGPSWTAYLLATAYHETNKTMQPVREAYWLSEDWRRKNLRYFPHYGRGYVQLTWPENYGRADRELGLDGALVANLDLAMHQNIAARIAVMGMAEGWFTGKSCGTYLPAAGKASTAQFVASRKIINGSDRAVDIATYALLFQQALIAGAWA
jgi:putative chitinase